MTCDIIVRRRLVQKMEFLNQGAEPLPAPTDAELERFLAAHADRYMLASRLTLDEYYRYTFANRPEWQRFETFGG